MTVDSCTSKVDPRMQTGKRRRSSVPPITNPPSCHASAACLLSERNARTARTLSSFSDSLSTFESIRGGEQRAQYLSLNDVKHNGKIKRRRPHRKFHFKVQGERETDEPSSRRLAVNLPKLQFAHNLCFLEKKRVSNLTGSFHKSDSSRRMMMRDLNLTKTLLSQFTKKC